MSAAVAAAAAAAAANVSYKSSNSRGSNQSSNHRWVPLYQPPQQPISSRYETRKQNDWNAFRQYLKNHRPNLILSRCSGVDVIEFLNDQLGNIKTHSRNCSLFENSDSSGSCSCPLMQAWSSLDGLVGRLRVAFEENEGRSGTNPFSAGVVKVYVSQVRDGQVKPKGMAYS